MVKKYQKLMCVLGHHNPLSCNHSNWSHDFSDSSITIFPMSLVEDGTTVINIAIGLQSMDRIRIGHDAETEKDNQ